MGVSTDGILAYGVDLGEIEELAVPWITRDEDGEVAEDEDLDFDDWVAKLAGADSSVLWASYEPFVAAHPELARLPTSEQTKAWEDANPGLREQLAATYAAQREAVAACPLEEVRHCSGDYPMLILAVRETVTKASRGSPVAIASLDVDEAAVARAVEFCSEHEIPFENPGWLLASMWWW